MNTSTRASILAAAIRLRLSGRAATRAARAAFATAMPAQAPSAARTRPSTTHCRKRRPRLGSEGDPERDLLSARGGPGGEKPGDVHACDQKEDGDPAEEREQYRPYLPNAVGLETDRVVAPTSSAVFGELPRDPGGDRVDFPPSLIERDAGSHPADDPQELLPARPGRHLRPEGNPGLEVVRYGRVGRQQKSEGGGHHADDRRRLPVDEDAAGPRSPDRRRTASATRKSSRGCWAARRRRRRPRGTSGLAQPPLPGPRRSPA